MSQFRHMSSEEESRSSVLWEAFSRVKITFLREAKNFLQEKIRPKRANEHKAVLCFYKVPYAWIWDSQSSLLHLFKQRFIMTLAFREWMKAIFLIKTAHYYRLSGGHAASLPRWKDATLANNKVSFFFRLCCRHSIIHCLFNRGLCEASALMQHIHLPSLWRECSHFCVFAFFFLMIHRGEFRWLSLTWRKSSVDFFLFQGCLACFRWWVSANTSPLGSMFQSGCPLHRKFISGYAEGHDMLYKHGS